MAEYVASALAAAARVINDPKNLRSALHRNDAMKTFTISAVAHRLGVSRSTLLYYDRHGLLRPSGRSVSGYRLYSETDLARAERLMLYREAGLALETIRRLLDAGEDRGREALTRRLAQINSEIHALRAQQRIIVRLLGDSSLARGARAMTKESWVSLLSATGLAPADMERWHKEFERRAPEAHQDFLESLGIPPEEILKIRSLSRSSEP